MSFAVVRFMQEEESYSEIPTIWILENKRQCYWPNQKNCGSLIGRSVTPSEDWSIQDIEVEGYYESLQKARKVAQNPSYTSNDEGERRKQKWNKWANYSGSDDEDSLNENITNDPTDEPPKSFKNKSCNEKVQILNVTTLGKNIDCDGSIASSSKTTAICEDEESSGLETVGSYIVHDGFLEPIQEDDGAENPAKRDEPCLPSSKLLDKIYKLQLQNNLYLKEIYKNLTSNCNATKPSNTYDFSSKFPIQNTNCLQEFEGEITSTEIEHELNSFIHKIGGRNFKDNVHRCLRTVYADNMAKSCSWLGLRGNFKIKDTKTMQVIKDVMKSTYSNTENDFEIIVKEWFRLAGTRTKLKKGEN